MNSDAMRTPMTRDEAKKWACTREQGLSRFIVVVGVGRVGGGFFAIFATLDYLTRYGLTYTPVLPHALRWVPGSIIVGATFGFLFYRIMERRYKQWVSDQ